MAGFSDKVAGTVKPNSTLSDFIGSIDSHIAGAEDILMRVSKLADLIGGPVPRDVSDGDGDRTPEQALNLRLQRKLARLGQLQAAAAVELGRLESSL